MQIHNGSNTRIWMDPWIPYVTGFKPLAKSTSTTQDLAQTIDSLFSPLGSKWNLSLLTEPFDLATIQAILKIRLTPSSAVDRPLWTPKKKGYFTVKSTYRLLATSQENVDSPLSCADWNKLWNLKVHCRLKLLLWKIVWNILPTGSRIHQCLPDDSSRQSSCLLCTEENESITHLLLTCLLAQNI